jgi:agmatine deiminase
LAEISEDERKKHEVLAKSGEILDQALECLKKETNLDGKPFEIVRIPMPPLMTRSLGPKDSMYQFIQSLKVTPNNFDI